MGEGTDPPLPSKEVAFTCPRCGAPLPASTDSGFVTCEFCGVRTNVSSLLPPQLFTTSPSGEFLPPGPVPEPTEDDDDDTGDSSYRLRIVIVIAMVAVLVVGLVLYSSAQPQPTSGGSSVAHCSVTINASAISGPAPFTATFTADITTPAGDSAGQPMWQFGPFPPGFDLNYTYGSPVTHTWDSAGSFGVHLTVPDSSGQGCYADMSITVT